ncbi:MAG: isochorismatase family cysteine hydrolase [Dehalococcoidia bacterium]
MTEPTTRRSALVVVDVQNGFVTDASRHVVPIIAKLAESWLTAGSDVVFTRYVNYTGSPHERILGWSQLKHSPEIDIVDALNDHVERAVAVVDKKVYTLFNDEGESIVATHGWTDLYICGIDTEVCVLKTAVDAFERGITPWIVTDASASHAGQAYHDAGLLVATKFIGRGQLVTTDAAGLH